MFRSFLLIVILNIIQLSYAEKAQENKVDNTLFDSIENRVELEKKIQTDIINTKNQIQNKDIINQLPGSAEAKKAENDLYPLRDSELETKGRNSKGMQKMHKKGFFVDYDAPGFKPHKEDAHDLVNASEKLMNGLIGKLFENGIDCKEESKTEEIDPAWKLEITEKEDKDVIYDKILCEHLRNQYDCQEGLIARCVRTGMQWGNWQEREHTFDPHFIWSYHGEWLYSIKWKEKRFGMHLQSNYGVMASMRGEIAKALGKDVSWIGEHISIDGRGRNGGGAGTFNIWGKSYMFYSYKVGYRYREGTKVCEQWNETWKESCRLSSP